MQYKPKVGLALGSGCSRGMAHIGVIEVLENHGIEIDMVAGASIGAVVGAMYCAGEDLKLFTRLAERMPVKSILDWAFSKNGLIQGNKLKQLLNLLLKTRNFSDLKIPLTVVSTDLIKCQRVILKEGNIAEALRASVSIPGVFAPHKYKNMLLVDGGVVERVPVKVLKEMGADIIIASDVGFNGGEFSVNSFFDVIIRSLGIMEKELNGSAILQADFVIKPEVEDINPATFENSGECVERGRIAAEKAADEILRVIAERRRKSDIAYGG